MYKIKSGGGGLNDKVLLEIGSESRWKCEFFSLGVKTRVGGVKPWKESRESFIARHARDWVKQERGIVREVGWE